MSGVVTTRAQRLGHTVPSQRRVVAEVVVASVVAGVAMGVVWWLLAPDVTGVVVDGGLALDARAGQKLFDRDAIFALLGAGCGLVLAVVFAIRHRHSPVTSLIALALGGLGASFLAMLVGELLGPDGDIGGLAAGAERAFPLDLGSDAGLIAWSTVATVVVAVVAAFREDPAPWSMPGEASSAPPES